MKTINKNQLYKFCKQRDACRNGLRRLKRLIRGPRTAREILEFYASRRSRLWAYTADQIDYKRGRDFVWLCFSLYLPSETANAQMVIDAINQRVSR